MKAIAVNGISGSGKTTVTETILRGLTARGYRVGSVKEIHVEDFRLDGDPSTNTARHRAAGAKLVTARAFGETDVLYPARIPLAKILSFYADLDYCILEGVSDCNAPRILTAYTESEVSERLDGRAAAVSGRIANDGRTSCCGLPVFSALDDPDALTAFVERTAFPPLPDVDPVCCSKCGFDCRGLAEAIVRGEKTTADCVLLQQTVTLTVDGAHVQMVPFVQTLLKNASLAVVDALDGVPAHGEYCIRFRR